MITFPLPTGGTVPLEQDTYYIQEEWVGWEDTLCFNLSDGHPQLPYLMERLALTDKESGQRFLIASIDEGKSRTDFVAALDLSEWEARLLLNYTNGSATAYDTVNDILPAGWTVLDKSGFTFRRTISLEGATPLDVAKQLPDTYPGLAVRFDNAKKQVLLFCPDNEQPSGAYFTDELNLTARPQFKGKAKDFYTRLYAVGKDGMTFADINDGKDYVECCSYDSRVICRYWKDERYTNPESLLAAAKATVNKAAVPERSYECSVNDLAKVDPGKYAYLGVSMYQAVALIDRQRNERLLHRVARYRRYPHHPEKNVVTLSTVPGTVSGRVSQVYAAVTDTAGLTPFQQRQQAMVENATAWLTGANGYALAVKNEDGSWKELLFMDTNDQTTAKNVLRINTNGIGFSTSGVGGPYRNAWTIDGSLSADFITAGTLNAAQIEVLNLAADAVKMSGAFAATDEAGNEMRLDSGSVKLHDADGNLRAEFYRNNSYYGGVIRFIGSDYYAYMTADGIGIRKMATPDTIGSNDTIIFDANYLGNVVAGNSVTATGGMSAGGDIAAKGSIYADGNVQVSKVVASELTLGLRPVSWMTITVGGTTYNVLGQ